MINKNHRHLNGNERHQTTLQAFPKNALRETTLGKSTQGGLGDHRDISSFYSRKQLDGIKKMIETGDFR